MLFFMHGAFRFELHCVSQPNADLARRTSPRMCVSILSLQGREWCLGTLWSVPMSWAEEHHVIQRTAEPRFGLEWTSSGYLVQPEAQVRAGTDQVTQALVQMNLWSLQGQRFRHFTASSMWLPSWRKLFLSRISCLTTCDSCLSS